MSVNLSCHLGWQQHRRRGVYPAQIIHPAHGSWMWLPLWGHFLWCHMGSLEVPAFHPSQPSSSSPPPPPSSHVAWCGPRKTPCRWAGVALQQSWGVRSGRGFVRLHTTARGHLLYLQPHLHRHVPRAPTLTPWQTQTQANVSLQAPVHTCTQQARRQGRDCTCIHTRHPRTAQAKICTRTFPQGLGNEDSETKGRAATWLRLPASSLGRGLGEHPEGTRRGRKH